MTGSSTYTEAAGLAICDRVLDGQSIREICLDPDMPGRATVLRWLAANPDFAMLYGQARRMAAEVMADDIIAIADDASGDWRPNADGELVFNSEAVARSRARIDARKWRLSKLLPKIYGDQPPEPVEHVHRLELSDQQREAVGRALAAKYALLEG